MANTTGSGNETATREMAQATDARSEPIAVESATGARSSRAWRVMHASEYVRDVLGVVEGQLAVGMRPYIVTPQGGATAEVYLQGRKAESRHPRSLLRAWQDVRNWRKSLLDCEPGSSFEIVHAHSFAAGMAAVRSCPAVVYDLSGFVEQLTHSADGEGAGTAASSSPSPDVDSGSWMGRSFRVAEQFVITRAAAVVVHSSAMREATLQRAAEDDNLFVIPPALAPEALEWLTSETGEMKRQADAAWLRDRGGLSSRAVTLVAPEINLDIEVEANGELTAGAQQVLTAFAIVQEEYEDATLVVFGTAGSPGVGRFERALLAAGAGLGGAVRVLAAEERSRAIAGADVVVAMGGGASDPGDETESAAMQAMIHGAALLAADVPLHRDISRDGRGCLWYREGDALDLAHRAAFLARNVDLRRTLAAAGRRHLVESRSPAALGSKYEQVYRHAFARKKSGTQAGPMPSLRTAPANI